MDGLLLLPDHTCSKNETRSFSCLVELGVASSARCLRGVLGVVAGLWGDVSWLLFREEDETDSVLEVLSVGDKVFDVSRGVTVEERTVFSSEVLVPVELCVKGVRPEGLLEEYVASMKEVFGRIDDVSERDVLDEYNESFEELLEEYLLSNEVLDSVVGSDGFVE